MENIEISVCKETRFHIHFPEPVSCDEALAVHERWNEQFEMGQFSPIFDDNKVSCLLLKAGGRRWYALLPAIIRKVKRAGHDISVSYQKRDMWPLMATGPKWLKESEHPAEFWAIVALAQMWYESPGKAKEQP